MNHPASPFMVLYNAYRIVRQGEPDGESSARGSLYYVQRPDGSECARDVTWIKVERIIRRDMVERGWPPDSLPPGLAAELDIERRAPSLPTPGAKRTRATTRPAARSR